MQMVRVKQVMQLNELRDDDDDDDDDDHDDGGDDDDDHFDRDENDDLYGEEATHYKLAAVLWETSLSANFGNKLQEWRPEMAGCRWHQVAYSPRHASSLGSWVHHAQERRDVPAKSHRVPPS